MSGSGGSKEGGQCHSAGQKSGDVFLFSLSSYTLRYINIYI